MKDENGFRRVFDDYAVQTLRPVDLLPRMSLPRLVEAHGAWCHDLHRVERHEDNLADGLDHLKQAGHLAFWLRRASPVIDVIDTRENIGDAEGYPLGAAAQEFRRFLFGYLNEYLAFDFALQICKFYEMDRDGSRGRTRAWAPSRDYYRTMCHFLKFKTASPHALFLIYKSLFEG